MRQGARIALCGALALAACDRPFLQTTLERQAPTDLEGCSIDGTADDLAATVHGGWISLSWTSAATNADGFLIDRRDVSADVSGAWGEIAQLSTVALFYNDYGAEPNHAYEYRARAYRTHFGDYCESAHSDTAAAISAPATPEDLVASVAADAAGAKVVRLTWLDPNHYEEGYRIERRQGDVAFELVANTAADVTLYDDPVAGTGTFHYRVTAFLGELASAPASANLRLSCDPYAAWGTVPAAWTTLPEVVDEELCTWSTPTPDPSPQPFLTDDCTLMLPGISAFDERASASYASATGSISGVPSAPAVTATADGISAPLLDSDLTNPNPGEPYAIDADWTVQDDLGGSTTLATSAELTLRSVDREVTRQPSVARGDDFNEGRQALLPGCSRCTGERAVITAGGGFSCYRDPAGNAYCWGDNDRNQAGLGRIGVHVDATPVCDAGGENHCDASLAGASDVAVGAGSQVFSCAVVNGRARCWGNGSWGVLGDNDNTHRILPVEVCATADATGCTSFLDEVAEVAPGEYFTCARLTYGGVKCWGSRSNLELGDGNTSAAGSELLPVDVVDTTGTPMINALAIEAGERHSCALVDLGSTTGVKCWGDNANRQLGLGGTGTTDQEKAVDVCAAGAWDIPTATCLDGATPSPLVDVTAVTAGAFHSCAVMSDLTARCWGRNTDGELGHGLASSYRSNPTPVCVTGADGIDCDPLTNVTRISAGYYFTCAVADGEAWCWGNDGSGRLGNDVAAGDELNPIPVCRSGSGLDCERLSDVREVVAGSSHACAIVDSGPTPGEVMCWGEGAYGRLGNRGDGEAWNPVSVCQGEPDRCEPISGVGALSVGEKHSCAWIETSGEVLCWGDGAGGLLGTPIADQQPLPIPVCERGMLTSCEALTNVETIEAGPSHACAVLSDGTAKCWGGNGYGALGHGGSPELWRTSQVCMQRDGDLCTPLTGVVAIAAGGGVEVPLTCALLEQGAISCWGANDRGQLGTGGAQTSSDVPRSVLCGSGFEAGCGISTPLGGAVAVDTGYAHACAVMEDGRVKCWGANGHGQLGVGDDDDRSVPTDVPITDAVAVALGGHHSCALLVSGHVACWGSNAIGQIGIGVTGGSISSPQYVCRGVGSGVCDPIDDAIAIAAAFESTCALLADGRVLCWGDGIRGQLGNGDVVPYRENCLVPGSAPVGQPVPDYVCAVDPYDACDPVPSGPCAAQLTDVVAISGGDGHFCAVTANQAIVCWGDNSELTLGDGGDRGSAVTYCGRGDGFLLDSYLARCAPTRVCAPGQDSCDPDLGTLWAWEPNAAEWTELVQQGTLPDPRRLASMTFHPLAGRTLMLGGLVASEGTAPYAFTWDGATWTRESIAGHTRRENLGLTYDPSREVVVAFGGTSAGLLPTKTWEASWQAATTSWSWTSFNPVLKPSGRHGHRLAFDSNRSVTVLFAGQVHANGAVHLANDLWEWDGVAWLMRSIAGDRPSPRRDFALVTETSQGRILLFGGFDGSHRQDLWSWDGSSWTELTPSGAMPPARARHVMVYDVDRDRVVLFGGYDGASFFSDVWEWSTASNSWTERAAAGLLPPARGMHAMAYDEVSQRVLLYGGHRLVDDNKVDDTAKQTCEVAEVMAP